MVVGISTDTVALQQKFTAKNDLNFPLFADADKSVARTYGVLSPDRGFAYRYTFIIDKKGIVRNILAVSDAGGHPAEVLKYVRANLVEKR